MTTTSTPTPRTRAKNTTTAAAGFAATDDKDPAPVNSWLRTWNPDRRWLHPLVTALWLHLLSWVSLTGLAAWWFLLGGLAFTAALVSIARHGAPAATFGDVHPRQITWLTSITGLLATVWLVWMGLHGPLNGPGLGALAIGTCVFGLLYAGWRSTSPKRAAVVTRTELIRQEVALRSEWSDILAAAGIKHMHVIDRRPHQAGYTLLLEHRRPTGPDAPVSSTITLNMLLNAGEAIAAEASRALAHTGAVISAKGVRAEETEWAHRFRLHVTTIDVLKSSIAFEPRTAPASILDPAHLGLYENGDPLTLTLCGMHCKIVGASRSGKSVLLNVAFARVLECDDALLWVAGASKLVPLVYPWLVPWIMGRTSRPVIDWVAGQDQKQVLIMLADMYHASARRADLLTTESKLIPSAKLPAIIGVLEEASDILTSTERIKTFDGKDLTASELAKEITQKGAAVNVTLWLATQYGLMPMAGPYGSEIHRNLLVRIALKTMTASDGRDTLVGMDRVDTTRLKHKSMLVQPDMDDARVLPAKAFHLEDASRIVPLAERYTAHLTSLDEYTAQALRGYAGRWDHDRITTLAEVIEREGYRVPTVGQALAPQAPARQPQQDGADDQSVIDARFAEIVGGAMTTDDTRTVSSTTSGAAPIEFDAGPTEALEQSLQQFGADMQAATERMGAVNRIGDPLATIAKELSMPGAPKDFVSTRQLAIVLDRVAVDASDDDVNKAAAQLGRDINKQVPQLKTEQRSIDGKQVRGYPIKRLWAAIHHLAYGKPMPADDTDTE